VVLHYLRYSQNQRGMAIYRPIKEEKGSPNARTTKSAHIKERTTNSYINSEARPKLAYRL